MKNLLYIEKLFYTFNCHMRLYYHDKLLEIFQVKVGIHIIVNLTKY